MPERLVDNPTDPDPATSWGDGFLCLDLGPEDGATWGRFKDVVEGDEDPESIARRAQVWRLPVTPYINTFLLPPTILAIAQILLAENLKVIDLTSMWAEPLSSLEAELGNQIEPSSRLDGLPTETVMMVQGTHRCS